MYLTGRMKTLEIMKITGQSKTFSGTSVLQEMMPHERSVEICFSKNKN